MFKSFFYFLIYPINSNNNKYLNLSLIVLFSGWNIWNIYNYFGTKNQKKEEKILEEKFIEDFSQVLEVNGLKNNKHPSTFTPNDYNFYEWANIEELIKKINIIVNNLKEIITQIKNAQYKQKFLLDEWTNIKNKWDGFKQEKEIQKELFDFFAEKDLLNKTNNYYLEFLKPKKKFITKNEINTILNKITITIKKIQSINVENVKKKFILESLEDLHQSWDNYKTMK